MNLLKEIISEYAADPLNDSEYIFELKSIIEHLPEQDKALILLYVDFESTYKVAKLLHVSQPTIFGHIKRIRNQISNQLSNQLTKSQASNFAQKRAFYAP